MSDIKLVLVTYPTDGKNGAEIRDFAATLVREKFAACVSRIRNVESTYEWDGELNVDSEDQLLIKTTEAKIPELIDKITELHPYDVPEILVLNVEDGSDNYLDWVRKNTSG